MGMINDMVGLGAIIGDVVGSRFEFHNLRSKDFELITKESNFTDDTIMTIAVMDALIDKKKNITDTIKKYGLKYFSSYGVAFQMWLYSNNKKPYNSFGNGAAMRVSSVGWLANSEDDVKKLSRYVTEVTHNHPEGIKGAEITAMCVYYARMGKSKEFIKNYVSEYYNLDFDYKDLVKNYKFNETCQETVPQAVYCFLISKDFEDCLRTCVSIGGDSDTLAAISCSIAEAYYKYIDDDLVNNVIDILPKDFIVVLDKFNSMVKY